MLPLLVLHEFRTMPMVRAILSLFLISPASKRQTLAACGTWNGPRLDPQTFSASSVRVLRLVGLLLGILGLLLWSGPGYGAPPQESLALTDGDLNNTDDAPLSLAGLTARDASPPSVSALRGIIGMMHASSWPLRYLARPQRLTRL
jgi:hypothetical protein